MAMATTAAGRKTLARTRTVLVGKMTRVMAPTLEDSGRIRLTAVSTRIRRPMGSTRAGTAVAGVRQTSTVARDMGRIHLPAGSTRTGTTGTAAVSRVLGTTGTTMTMGGRAAGLTGTRTREVSRLRFQLS